mmetsp:Transcript_77761/g.128878  ORF Transcript_77761/g.128878 Transcript_77761/m.128878 type:complete len:259 (+) Transcript_77761:58-834(+)
MRRLALELACLVFVIRGRRVQNLGWQLQERSSTGDQKSQPINQFAAVLRLLARDSQAEGRDQQLGSAAAYNPSPRQRAVVETRISRRHPSRSFIGCLKDLRGGDANNTDEEVQEFQVIPVAGNGDCMFQSVAQGLSVAAGQGVLSGITEHMRGMELRAQAMEELKRRREEIEWAIEGNFKRYVKRMSKQGKWGGEPELLMLSHSLQCPILVYTYNPDLRLIQTYGEELQGSPLRLLFHGQGHYEALIAVSKHGNQTET